MYCTYKYNHVDYLVGSFFDEFSSQFDSNIFVTKLRLPDLLHLYNTLSLPHSLSFYIIQSSRGISFGMLWIFYGIILFLLYITSSFYLPFIRHLNAVMHFSSCPCILFIFQIMHFEFWISFRLHDSKSFFNCVKLFEANPQISKQFLKSFQNL